MMEEKPTDNTVVVQQFPVDTVALLQEILATLLEIKVEIHNLNFTHSPKYNG